MEGKSTYGISAIAAQGDQPDEAWIECPPMGKSGADVRHMVQPVKLGKRPVTEPGQFGAPLFGDIHGLSAQMDQAGWAPAGPFAIKLVVVADQDLHPL